MLREPSTPAINIALCFDRYFQSVAAVALQSIVANSKRKIHFHLFTQDVCHNFQDELIEWLSTQACQSKFYDLTHERLEGLPLSLHASMANYYRLLIPELVDPSVSKLLYLDSDVLLRDDVGLLFEIPLDNYLFAARPLFNPGKMAKLGLSPGKPYLNSGVLLIDAATWRETNQTERHLQIAFSNCEKLEFWDQDVLALGSEGVFKKLSVEWNASHEVFSAETPYFEDQDREIKLVHFTGDGLKPWESGCSNPLKKEFWEHHAELPKTLARTIPKRLPNRNSVKSIGKACLRRLAGISPFAFLHNSIAFSRPWKAAAWNTVRNEIDAQQQKKVLLKKQRNQELARDFFEELIVKTGPFKGLEYVQVESVCSAILPKLAGTYEAELHGFFKHVSESSYEAIVDVGCAEGYYAVGLSRLLPDTPVFAFDLSAKARRLCKEMAAKNGVADRVQLCEVFFPEFAESLNSTSPGSHLYIFDVEGAETLFFEGTDLVKDLSASDVVIECHDFVSPGITQRILDCLSPTHDTKCIRSSGDIFRPMDFCPSFLASEPFAIKQEILSENRPAEMRWVIAKSRCSA